MHTEHDGASPHDGEKDGNEDYKYEFPNIFRSAETAIISFFQLQKRGATISSEFIGGTVAFLSCMYVLPVLPGQLALAGYSIPQTTASTSMTCAIGSVLAGLLSNLPFIIAPPTPVSIFLQSYLRQNSMSNREGNQAVMISGFLMFLLCYKPVARLFNFVVPQTLQAAVAVGIGVLVAFAGATEVDLIVEGKYTILALGPMSHDLVIAMFGVIIIGTALHYHVKGAFTIALCFCSIVHWAYLDSWPNQFQLVSLPDLRPNKDFVMPCSRAVISLAFQLWILYCIYLNGLVRAFGDLAHLTVSVKKGNNTIEKVPGGSWLYPVCASMTILSGLFQGSGVLVSPETGGAIKGGSKTGLAAVFCGIYFGLSIFFGPLFSRIPKCGTAPLLFSVGVVLFGNVSKITWDKYSKSFPAFIIVFLIPFTYSILDGVEYGWFSLMIIAVLSGDMINMVRVFLLEYFPDVINDQLLHTAKKSHPSRPPPQSSLQSTSDVVVWASRIGLFPVMRKISMLVVEQMTTHLDDDEPVSGIVSSDLQFTKEQEEAEQIALVPQEKNPEIKPAKDYDVDNWGGGVNAAVSDENM